MKISKMFTAVAVAVLLMFVVGCIEPKMDSQQVVEAKKKIDNVNSLLEKQPATPLDFSMDRYLLDQRNVRFNDPNKMSYLYMFVPMGPTLQVTIVGKVASTSKRLSTPVQTYKIDRGQYTGTDLGPAPDDMAVYSHSSGNAKVCLTTVGSLLEFGGAAAYFYSEVPLIFAGLEKPMVKVTTEATPAQKAALLKQLKTLKAKARM